MLLVAGFALVGVPSAKAGPPRSATITAVGKTYGHLKATWTLPRGVEPQVIEVGSSPAVGPDGHFLEENQETLDFLGSSQTSYVDFDQLGFGTHWVHIETLDTDCSTSENATCLAWSNILALTIKLPANVRPELRLGRFDTSAHEAQVTACDETSGQLTFRTTLSADRLGRGYATRRRTSRPLLQPTYTEGERNCSRYYVPLPELHGSGRYTLTMTVTDARGGKSNPVVRRWTVRSR